MRQPVFYCLGESGDIWVYSGTVRMGTERLGGPVVPLLLRGGFEFRIEGRNFRVPVGFACDGASVPDIITGLTGLRRRGVHDAAWLVHDFLYSCKGKVDGISFRRSEVDRKFRDDLRKSGMKNWHVWLCYRAVRALGWIYWNKK